MLIKDALIMEIMTTQNGLDITKEMVENSLSSFKNVPIVYNEMETFKDYREESFKDYYNKNIVIGFVTENIKIVDDEVLADIVIRDEYIKLWAGKYDNWCITLNEDKTSFTVQSIEIF